MRKLAYHMHMLEIYCLTEHSMSDVEPWSYMGMGNGHTVERVCYFFWITYPD